jgi:2-polyprenyl-3-methyl-5-hydroxy-6-metoxy-1,4-benzoquinol methylase
MIEIAKRKAVERKIFNVDFTQGTIFDECLKKGSFDVLLAFNILHYLEDTPEGYAKNKRIIKTWRIFHFFNRMYGRGEEVFKNSFFSCVD